MPIKDGIIYLDNTYLKDVATCQTKAYLLRVLGLSLVDNDMTAAKVGNVFHKGVEVYCKSGGDSEAAMEAFDLEYDRLIGSQVDPLEDEWQKALDAGIRVRSRED